MADYTIVLRSIAKGRYIQVAEALKSTLGLQEQVVGRIVSTVPIALFDRLEEGQARAMAQAMAPAREAGAAIEVAPRAGSNCARMSWPTLPKIAGRDIESFASAGPSAALRCPVCGAALALVSAGAPTHAPAPAAAQLSSVVESGPAFEVTGEDDLEMLGEIDVGTRTPDVPQVPPASKTPANLGSPAKPSTQAGVPMDLADFEAAFADQAEEELGRDDVLQELGQAQGKPVAGTPARAAPPQPKTPAGSRPTGTRAMPPSAKPKAPSRAPARSTKAAGSRTPARARSPKSGRAGSGSMPSAGSGSYSVFAAKSSSPRFLKLVAEVRGISLQQAQQLGKRQIIQLARDVNQKQAEAIRDRFLAERFQAQVHSSKGG